MFSAYSEDDGLASAKVVKELRPFPRLLEIIEVSSTTILILPVTRIREEWNEDTNQKFQ